MRVDGDANRSVVGSGGHGVEEHRCPTAGCARVDEDDISAVVYRARVVEPPGAVRLDPCVDAGDHFVQTTWFAHATNLEQTQLVTTLGRPACEPLDQGIVQRPQEWRRCAT